MSLSIVELARVIGELAAALPGARVQKLYVPAAGTALLELRHPGRSMLLQLDVGPGVGRVGIVEERPPSPEHPLAAQGLWRAHLTGARLDRLEPLGRGARFDFSTDDGVRSVIAELDRRGGELFLLDAAGRVLGTSPGERARNRALLRGATYSAPPVAPEPVGRDRLEAGAASASGPFPISALVARLYGVEADARRLTETRADALSGLRTARKRLARTISRVREDRERISEASRYQRYGDLLKPMLSRLKRGDIEATVTDYALDGPVEVQVPLLPHLGPRENLERYYHLYRRLSRAAGRVDERLSQLEGQLQAVDALLETAARAPDPDELRALLDQARAAGLLREPAADAPDAPGQPQRKPYREFTSVTGARIWVGRNARDNDALTFRHARGNDSWLHVRGQSGSHVVIPGVGPQGPEGDTLLDAAELAAHFSSARTEALVDVSATRAKYVRKPRGGTPGAVLIHQERTVALRREPDRLARLLATEQRAGT